MISIETAFFWLNKFQRVDTYMSRASLQLITQMNEALSNDNFSGVWTIIERLQYIGERASKDYKEQAEIYANCGQFKYQLGDRRGAANSFQQAAIKYLPDKHNVAVAQWMKGYVLWQIPGEKDNAIVEWNKSIDAFNKKIIPPKNATLVELRWYSQKI